MRLTSKCQDCINNAESIFDFMSAAMELIVGGTTNENTFVAYYYLNNPELKKLVAFVKKLLQIRRFSYFEIIDVINSKIDELDCKGFDANDPLVSLAVLYAILLGIDASFPECINKGADLGPLDKAEANHRFRIYRTIIHPLNAAYIDMINRDQIRSKSITQSLEHFIFLDTTIWDTKKTGSIPEGYLVKKPKKKNIVQLMVSQRKVVIGISPFCKEKNFKFSKVVSNLESVKYFKHQEYYCKIAVKILEKVSEKKCDVFVMPEFIASPEVFATVKKKLSEMHSNNMHTPLLVFPGSQWTSNNENALTILDCMGENLGEYYKYSNYRSKLKANGVTKVSEALNNPGGKCNFFGVEDVGVFLPSICRDTIDHDYTRDLAKWFFPLFVINSAFSPSVSYPVEQFHTIGYEYFVSSVFANACSAVKKSQEKDSPVGFCHIVSKGDSSPLKEATLACSSTLSTTYWNKASTPTPAYRSMVCKAGCESCGEGCLYIAEFYFGQKRTTMPTLEVYRFDVE